MEPEFLLFASAWRAAMSRLIRSVNELINFQCDTKSQPQIFWNRIARFLFLDARRKVPCAQIVLFKNDCAVRQRLCVCTVISLYRWRDGHLKFMKVVVSRNVSSRTVILSQSKWSPVSSQTTQQMRYDMSGS